jgi:hypothetical protein
MDDLQWWYGAPVTALAFNDNVVFIHIQPGNSVGQPAQAPGDFQAGLELIQT